MFSVEIIDWESASKIVIGSVNNTISIGDSGNAYPGKANCSEEHYLLGGAGVSKAIRVRYENGVLKPLEPVRLREGEEVRVKVVESVREKLKDVVGVLGESSEEELERYLGEVWQA